LLRRSSVRSWRRTSTPASPSGPMGSQSPPPPMRSPATRSPCTRPPVASKKVPRTKRSDARLDRRVDRCPEGCSAPAERLVEQRHWVHVGKRCAAAPHCGSRRSNGPFGE
jgi:hypothetical protein